ncbi:IS110 family transposase [Jiangella alba]|uniref:Transposase n=1 Tax=Jiangella alba TaxID=561176 RepID=A0A1H5JFI2_9ACTN|nr:transposase [Jiangella alba]SEE51209.1 Transposase [Jiangella alba]
MSVLQVALAPSTVVVAVDPGNVMNRVWVSNGAGLVEEPVSLPVARSRIAALEKMLAAHGGELVIAIEATGSLHRAWAGELERLHPGAIRLFAPSETRSARTQLGSGRFKTDDRDCAALTYLARQGVGRGQGEESAVEELRAAVRHRRGLVAERKTARLAPSASPARCAKSRHRLSSLCAPTPVTAAAGHRYSGPAGRLGTPFSQR